MHHRLDHGHVVLSRNYVKYVGWRLDHEQMDRKRMTARRADGVCCAIGADDCFDFRASAPLNKIPLGQCTCYVGINI